MNSRRQARVAVFQAMYSLGEDMVGDVGQALEGQRAMASEEGAAAGFDEELAARLCQGVQERREEAIGMLDGILDSPFDSISQVERLVLVLAIVERLCRPDTPHAVVVNEWVAITKEYGSANGYRLVNAILDKGLPPRPAAGG